jgi:hypothetical protein
MSPKKPGLAVILALSAGILGTMALSEQQALMQLRQENLAQRKQLEQLVTETRNLSNRLFQASLAPSQPPGPSRELLRLRGEVGLLRRQLQEVRQAGSARFPGGPQLQDLRNRGQAVYLRLKALSDGLQRQANDPRALLDAISASGIQDSVLSSLLDKRQALRARQQESGGQEPQSEDLAGQVANLDASIERRSRGILLGFTARANVMNKLLEDLPNSSGDAMLDSVIGLENFLSQADKPMQDSPAETTSPEQSAAGQPAAGPPSSAPSVTPPRLNPEAIAKAREAMHQKMATLDAEQQTEQTTTGAPQ